jgi:AcrR family transcriptional regulator
MSLYNHVAGKDDLLDSMVEFVIAWIELPSAALDWKEAMRRRSTSAHAVLLRHPWATLLILSRINSGPFMLRYVDATIGCLRRAGFSPALTDHAWNAIDNHVYGFTLQALSFPLDPGEYAETARSFLPLIPPETHPHLNEMARLVISGEHDGINDFRFGLDLILDGLERMRESG